MIDELSGWLQLSNGSFFYHNIYIKIAEKCILKFEYHYNEEKNLWYFYSYELVDNYP